MKFALINCSICLRILFINGAKIQRISNEPMKITEISFSHLTSVSGLRKLGFVGFRSIESLRKRVHLIPFEQGVYLLVRKVNLPPKFLSIGTGGHFKNKDPNVPIRRLKNEWVSDATIV